MKPQIQHVPPVAAPSIPDVYLQLFGAEAKYFPFFGEAGFQGEYGILSLQDQMRGLLRMLLSAVEVERSALEKSERQLALILSKPSEGETETRFKRGITHVCSITKARLEATTQAIEGLEALVANNYGDYSGDGESSDSEDDSGDTTDLEKAYAVRTEDNSPDADSSGGN
jgi:hypothetical protein